MCRSWSYGMPDNCNTAKCKEETVDRANQWRSEDIFKIKSVFVWMFTNRFSYISGVFDLFFPLKNSGSALRSIAWTLKETEDCVVTRFFSHGKTITSYLNDWFLIRIILKLCVVTVPVIVKPSSIARDNDMMGLFSDIILMKVRTLHRFSFYTRRTFFFFLETHKHIANH